MNVSRWQKSLILFAVTLGVITTTVAFAILHHDDGDARIDFALTDQSGNRVTDEDFAGQYLLVFFGFTSCREICPLQMGKLTNVISALDAAGYHNQVTPVFISVDPERDDPQRMTDYLQNFHNSFVGLTGTRSELTRTAGRFKTFLDNPPRLATPGYQLTHSSVVYVVDPASRLIDYIPLEHGSGDISKQIQTLLQTRGVINDEQL